MKKLVTQELDEPDIEQDAGRNRVKDAVGDEGLCRAGGIGGSDAEPNGNGKGGGDAKEGAEKPRQVALFAGPGGKGQTGAETKALKHLVEDEDGVEGRKLVARDGEREADKDGVEDDTKLKDEDGA